MNTPAPTGLKADTIDEVIHALDKIIDWAISNKSRQGYFAALYRKVTIQVKEGIETDFFDDGPRMERLDVLFANRYLDAFENYHSAGPLIQSWKLAFDASQNRWPIVLQHLMLGMNAHIDLDLGIAAAETVEQGTIEDLKADFYKINTVLASLVDEVQAELAQVWRPLKWLDQWAGGADEALANLGMKIFRGHAWEVAQELSVLAGEAKEKRIQELDEKVVKMGRQVLKPGFVIRLLLLLIRMGELRSVSKVIQILE